jgi:hypothetical protein
VAELFRVRLDEAIAEVERELDLRRAFYPHRVGAGKMTRVAANRQLGRLQAARDFLVELRTLRGGGMTDGQIVKQLVLIHDLALLESPYSPDCTNNSDLVIALVEIAGIADRAIKARMRDFREADDGDST